MSDESVPHAPRLRSSNFGQSMHKSRVWCIPPAILNDPTERLEGERILAENAGDFGLLLWRTARDVVLWATTPIANRSDLFADASAGVRLARLATTPTPIDIGAAVDTINGMLTLGSRGDAQVTTVCCLSIASWARRNGLVHTSVAFAQAGAQASPFSADAALATGITVVAAKQPTRADSWFRRAIDLARRERNAAVYATALLERALLVESINEAALAERLYRKAYRAAQRAADRHVRARSAHGVFRLAQRRGDDATARAFALIAVRTCSHMTPGQPDLLYDVGEFWIESGNARLANAALAHLWAIRSTASGEPGKQLLVAALTARVSADTSPERSALAAAEAWDWMGDLSIGDAARLGAARHLAYAARVVRDSAAFVRARRVLLCLTPKAEFEAVEQEFTDPWFAAEEHESDVRPL